MFKPRYDQWKPGEHNGTFRGNNHAFVTATCALETFWRTGEFAEHVQARAGQMTEGLEAIAAGSQAGVLTRKGRGLMQGLSCADGDVASAISAACFDLGMVIETSGSEGQVVKCLVPLTISEEELATGLGILGQAVNRVVGKPALKKAS